MERWKPKSALMVPVRHNLSCRECHIYGVKVDALIYLPIIPCDISFVIVSFLIYGRLHALEKLPIGQC